MALTTSKRKAQDVLEEATKGLRIYKNAPSLVASTVDEDEEDECQSSGSYDSDDIKSAGTPVTPFSPSRKKFPSELKTIKCTYEGCTKTFNRPARLTAHLRTHTSERPYVCKVDGCDKSYFEDKHLQQHIKGSHTKERQHHCHWKDCGKSFLTSTRLNRHKDTHVGHERFRCTAYWPCNQTFRKHQTLQRHIRSDHLHLTPFPCTFVDPLTRQVCNAGFDGATGLRQHVDRVHGPPKFACLECDAPGFKTEKQLQSHIRKEHANCLFCDLKFSSQQGLLKHIESQHSGSTLEERKNVPCPYTGCNKKFTKQNNLNTHIRSAHMGERYICGSFSVNGFDDSKGCGNDFVSKASLVDHIRTAHHGLPSIVNSNRTKSSLCDDDFVGDEDDEYQEKKKSKRKGRKAKVSAVDGLLGLSYAADTKRTIYCLHSGCPHMFTRNYDLQLHMQSSHPYDVKDFDSLASTFGSSVENQNPASNLDFSRPQFDDDDVMGEPVPQPEVIYDHADVDWELQRQALEAPFWVGSDETERAIRDQDDWTQDQLEMRRLIG